MSGLTEFQADVVRLFFSLPASEGFLLAGGSGLLAAGLTTRPTRDLDFFGTPDDLAIDAPPGRPPFVTTLGPTFDPEELAGRKLAALFDRAEARDFADVYALAQRFDRPLLLQRAAEVDRGFSPSVLADMMRAIDRLSDDEVPVGEADVEAVRDFFRRWADEIGGSSDA